jgi:hypothetical protein
MVRPVARQTVAAAAVCQADGDLVRRAPTHAVEPAGTMPGYPDLEREDIQQALEYAAWLAQEQVQQS